IIAFIYKYGSFKEDLYRIIKSVSAQFKSHFFETISHTPPISPRHKKTIAWGTIITLSFTAGYLLILSIAIGTLTVLSANELSFFNVLVLLALTLAFSIMFFLQWGEAHKTAKEK
ncbi:hypothetical protein, partial [Ketobacter nezhaii]|uniref:hypothetical protein n=1 Tax=Ketobacter sp. MCCC 1A13808 TaxID=2602738 RepID=UPI001E49F9DA